MENTKNEQAEIALTVYNKIIDEYEKRKSQEQVANELNIPLQLVREVTKHNGMCHTVRRQYMPLMFLDDFSKWKKLYNYKKCIEK